MLKLVGALLVLISAVWIGLKLKQQLAEHLRQLIGLKEILVMLSGEISYGKTPLAEAFYHIAERGKAPFDKILVEVSRNMERDREHTLYHIWKSAVEGHRKEFLFSEEEMKIFVGLGENLGYLDVTMQINNLKIFIQQIEEKIAQAQKELLVKQKLCQSLSVMSGLFLILLFI